MNLQQQIPELSPAQWKLLERVLREKVIGEWEEFTYEEGGGTKEFRDKYRREAEIEWVTKNQLRATQRKALRSLLYGGEK